MTKTDYIHQIKSYILWSNSWGNKAKVDCLTVEGEISQFERFGEVAPDALVIRDFAIGFDFSDFGKELPSSLLVHDK